MSQAGRIGLACLVSLSAAHPCRAQDGPAADVVNDWGTANTIAWHFAGMWLLLFGFVLFVGNGVVTGHFRRDFLPVGPRSFFRDFVAAATFKLGHRLGQYNAVQKTFYWGVMFALLMMVLSGLSIWKPVQLGWLTWLFGGFPTARVVHFCFMTATVAFIVVHVVLVALVPKTLVAMTLGLLKSSVGWPTT